MGKRPDPIFVGEVNAAHILDLDLKSFRGLVARGILPKPKDIGGFARWCVADLKTISSGETVDGFGGIQW